MKTIRIIDEHNNVRNIEYKESAPKDSIANKVERILNPRPVTYVIKRVQ